MNRRRLTTEKYITEHFDMENGVTLISCGIFWHEPESVLAAGNGIADHWLDAALHADAGRIKAALPRIPILFLFNDAAEQFPARASILYERRAAHFLDAEFRTMVDWYLQEHLKRAEPSPARG